MFEAAMTSIASMILRGLCGGFVRIISFRARRMVRLPLRKNYGLFERGGILGAPTVIAALYTKCACGVEACHQDLMLMNRHAIPH